MQQIVGKEILIKDLFKKEICLRIQIAFILGPIIYNQTMTQNQRQKTLQQSNAKKNLNTNPMQKKESSKQNGVRNSQANHLPFHQIPLFQDKFSLESYVTPKEPKIEAIRSKILGFNTHYSSPLQIQLEAVYVDHTATNRPYQPVQTMIEYAKKFVANPHTEYSHYGKYSTQMMHYAHDSLLKSFHAKPQQFIVLPAGNGCTGAIEKTIKMLKIIEQTDKTQPTIFMTSYQHHSNILPWVEYYDQQVKILAHDQNHDLLIQEIIKQLEQCPSKRIIVTVSAASNVTSKITNLKELNDAIKKARLKKEIIFCVDCAAFCCHHQLNLKIYDEIDFAFMSPHKNLGGAESCGILLARKKIIEFAKPTFPGGGTVRLVTGYSKQDVIYSEDIFQKQIAGTPPFLGFYRAALSFQVLRNIGYDYIHQRQFKNTKLFVDLINEANKKLKSQGHDTQIVIYGDQDFTKRANVITFNFQYGKRFVYHSFASLICSDLFGIQLRSGCFCAGPFGKNLLNIDQQILDNIQQQVRLGILIDKPGYLRLDLTFYLQQFQVAYIAKAIEGIARNWRNMQKFYTVCNDGQIKRYQFKEEIQIHQYSLRDVKIAEQTVVEAIKIDPTILQNRRDTLQRQLGNGLFILQKPIDFLKKMKVLLEQQNKKVRKQ